MALSADRILTVRNNRAERVYSLAVKTGTTVYKGALLVTNAAGTAQPATNITTTPFFGVADAGYTATETSRVLTNLEVQLPLKTSVTVGMVGDAMYCADDQYATNLNTLGPQCGVLTEFTSANLGWVLLGGSALSNAS